MTYRSRGVMVCGLRTSTLADRDAQIFRGTDDWNRLRTGPLRIKTTVTVQLRTRSMRGLVVAVHLRTRTVRGSDHSDARGCGKIRGRPYCHSAYHWTGPTVVTGD